MRGITLTAQQKADICAEHNCGHKSSYVYKGNTKELADKYGVNVSCIRNVTRKFRKTHKNQYLESALSDYAAPVLTPRQQALGIDALFFSKRSKERFMALINKRDDGCWIFGKGTSLKKYPPFAAHDGKGRVVNIGAHRLSWFIFKEIPANGLFVCHRCDNPRCVNPDHLFLGTCQDNLADMRAKGRGVNGLKRRGTVLNPEKVKTIWNLHRDGKSISNIGQQLGVSPTTIRNVVIGSTWKYVPPSEAELHAAMSESPENPLTETDINRLAAIHDELKSEGRTLRPFRTNPHD